MDLMCSPFSDLAQISGHLNVCLGPIDIRLCTFQWTMRDGKGLSGAKLAEEKDLVQLLIKGHKLINHCACHVSLAQFILVMVRNMHFS